MELSNVAVCSRNSKHYCWYRHICGVRFWLPGLLEEGEKGSPHSFQKRPGDVNPNSNIPGLLFRLMSLQRVIEEWWSRVIGEAAFVDNGCKKCGFSRAGTWTKIASFQLFGQCIHIFSWLYLHLFGEQSESIELAECRHGNSSFNLFSPASIMGPLEEWSSNFQHSCLEVSIINKYPLWSQRSFGEI